MNENRTTDVGAALSRRDVLLRALAGLALGGITSVREALAGPVTTDEHGDMVQTVQRGELPEFVRGSADTSRLYRFATDHAGDLDYIPCFCGCKNIGHRSNRDCYLKSLNKDETVTYTSHAST